MDDLTDLKGDLKSVAEVIGRQNALFLVSQCPRYKVSKRPGQGLVMLYVPQVRNIFNHPLATAVGFDTAYQLSKHFGGELLTFSQCKHIILKHRNQGILQMLQQGYSRDEVAEIFGLTVRAISGVMKN